MFLNHEYIGKYEQNQIKVEFYDTGERVGFFNKILAYQVFSDNILIDEGIYSTSYLGFTPLKLFNTAVNRLALDLPELKQIEHIPEFEVIE